MAAQSDKNASVLTNGSHETRLPVELTVHLPQTPGIELHLHLTILTRTIVLFVTSTSADVGRQSAVMMGSFVYAIPNRYNANEPMTTTLYHVASSVDFATRMAKLLARKTGLPCYVGNSINLTNTPGGGSIDEEMEAFRAVVDIVLKQITANKDATAATST